MAAYVAKAELDHPPPREVVLTAQKTMYGGRRIAVGEAVFLFASETQGGRGLAGRGVVTAATPTPPKAGVARQTPRVSVTVGHVEAFTGQLGRSELRPYRDHAGAPAQAELDFKLYRQATNKIVGLSAEAEAFLGGLFADVAAGGDSA